MKESNLYYSVRELIESSLVNQPLMNRPVLFMSGTPPTPRPDGYPSLIYLTSSPPFSTWHHFSVRDFILPRNVTGEGNGTKPLLYSHRLLGEGWMWVGAPGGHVEPAHLYQ